VEVQIFGVNKSAETRKALRFFSERRIKTHFVDLTVRAASIGELQRFAQRFGATSLVNRASRRFLDLGLQHTVLSDERWIQKLSEEPMLLKMPLVRNGRELTVGIDEATWNGWLEKTAARPQTRR
jgi:arsenate reductase